MGNSICNIFLNKWWNNYCYKSEEYLESLIFLIATARSICLRATATVKDLFIIKEICKLIHTFIFYLNVSLLLFPSSSKAEAK